MAVMCMQCGKVAENGLDLCEKCEGQNLIVELRFDDFWKDLPCDVLRGKRDPSMMDSKVVHLTPEEAGIVIPTWVEERVRILNKCNMSMPQCLADYSYLVHQVCIDKYIRRGGLGYWHALIIVTSLFNKDWCIKRYYDPGDDGNRKKGIKPRSRGWKVYIFNPFNYMEWAMTGFKEWVVMWLRAGVTRKQLIMKAEEIAQGSEE